MFGRFVDRLYSVVGISLVVLVLCSVVSVSAFVDVFAQPKGGPIVYPEYGLKYSTFQPVPQVIVPPVVPVLAADPPFDVKVEGKGGGGVITNTCRATAWPVAGNAGPSTFNLKGAGANGYKTINLPAGAYDLTISCPGYIPRTFRITVTPPPVKSLLDAQLFPV